MDQKSIVAQVAEDRRAFSHVMPADLEALRRTCGQPPNAMPLTRYYAGEEISDAPAWRGLRVEIIGFQLTPNVSTVPVFHPWVYDELPQINGPCIIARWLSRHPDRPGVLEVAWDGRQRPSMRLKRSIHFLGSGAVEDAARLLALWGSGVEQAPQPASQVRNHRSRQSHLDQAANSARYLVNDDPTRRPTKQAIADFIAAEEQTEMPLSTLKSRWHRDRVRFGEKPITLKEVLSVAREGCIS